MSFQARCALYLISIVVCTIEAKVFERCELARELHGIHDIPIDQLATWVCIAYHESRYDTAARNPGSGDHGIFQISEHYWCSASGDDILACGLPCSAFEDDDIEDDVICARRAYRQHQRLSGNGFNAWSVYRYYCSDPIKVDKYIAGCFGKEDLTQGVTSKISNGTRVPKLMFFIRFKYTKHFEDSYATTPRPTSTTTNNAFPSFIPVIVPQGCYSCNPITNSTSHNHSHHHHHHHYHHVHIHNESSIFRPNVSLSSPSNNHSLTVLSKYSTGF
ncbi:uncharacterized protein LOC112906652 [Agrilus planipennis]|uniref:lysozyme n=1 Tax=Agrilus planipennis TaxID=224129 RepID=A0A7F5RLV1_AGRPL|nr:uncharacterized protein LOC112906652 [Agrilus planipennis]